MRQFLSLFSSQTRRPDVSAIVQLELEALSKQFYISRTGVEMLDYIAKHREPADRQVPAMLDTYQHHRKTEEEYEALDEQLDRAKKDASNMLEFRGHAENLHYANCTTLACFMHEALLAKDIHSKIFSIGGAHHFVIARDENTPNTIVIIDPWANTQFSMQITYPIETLDDLSIQDRLDIAKTHYENTNLYPDYQEAFDKLLAQDPHCSKKLKERYSKQFFEITTTDRFYEFENTHSPSRHP